MTQALEQLSLPKISPVTDEDILAYLRYSCKIAEIATLAEQDALVLAVCDQFNITVSDEEWQTAGDAFRHEYKLLGTEETFNWLNEQRITVEQWSYGIKVKLLAKKLKEFLFGVVVDNYYLTNRHRFKPVALSQILVTNLTEALTIEKALREDNASFCALALQYSKGKQSQQSGGFVGVQLPFHLIPEIEQAISEAKEGELIGPIETRLGYHLLKIEKWFPTELTEMVREQIMESLYQDWLKQYFESQGSENKVTPILGN